MTQRHGSKVVFGKVARRSTRPPVVPRPPTEATQGTIGEIVTSQSSGSTNPSTVDLTTLQEVGDLMFMQIDSEDGFISYPTGWTVLVDEYLWSTSVGYVSILYRVADGTEGTTTTLERVDPVGHTSYHTVWFVKSSEIDFSSFPPDVSLGTKTADTGTIDFPTVSVSHGAGIYRVFPVAIHNGGTRTITATPSGYNQLLDKGFAETRGHWLGEAPKNVTATEDPGSLTFTNWASSRIGGHTIAVLVGNTGELATGDHTHTEADVTDLNHWTETDHDALDHTGLTGVGASDHGALTGKSDDDHTQYLLAAGTRAATYLEVSGLTGATGISPRFVGGNASGAPASGTFQVGDYVVNSDGSIYICTTAGTPGTWTAVSGGGGASALNDLSDVVISSPSSGQVVKYNGTNWVNDTDATGGSSTVFDGKDFVHSPASSADAMDDEFNDGTNFSGPTNGLDAQWSKRNLGTASWLVLDDAVAPGCLYLDIPSGQSADQAIYQAVPTGDFTVATRVAMHQNIGGRVMFGLFVVDASGNGDGIFVDNGDDDHFIRQVTSWANGASSTDTGIDIPRFSISSGLPVWMTMSWNDTTETATFGLSLHDRLLDPTFETSKAFSGTTIASVGVGRIFGTVEAQFIIDSFRRLA